MSYNNNYNNNNNYRYLNFIILVTKKIIFWKYTNNITLIYINNSNFNDESRKESMLMEAFTLAEQAVFADTNKIYDVACMLYTEVAQVINIYIYTFTKL